MSGFGAAGSRTLASLRMGTLGAYGVFWVRPHRYYQPCDYSSHSVLRFVRLP